MIFAYNKIPLGISEEKMLSALKYVNTKITGLILPAVLFVSGLYFLLRIGKYVFSPRFIVRALKKPKSTHNNNGEQSSSPFSSLCLALAGTLGVGNITGVTAAVIAGGAGAVFWIWVSAAVSAVLKYAETVLAVKYRQRDRDGRLYGGAHLYIKNGLHAPGLSVIFCIACVLTSFTMGSITQAKAASDGVFVGAGIPHTVCGALFLITVLFLSFGGAEKISAFTLRLIPPLCLAYVALSLAVIFIFRNNFLYVTSAIFSEAFTPRAGVCGVLGFFSSPAMRYGVTRGIMSSEAGCGTAPMAHARAETDSPVRQGLYGMAEVLCDTVILCSLTAYAVLLSSSSLVGNSTEVAMNAFASALGEPVKLFLGLSLLLFALGSVAGWSFYGQEAVKALGFGKTGLRIYGVLLAISAFIGCVMPENAVWELADLSIAVMAIINMLSVLLLSSSVTKITRAAARSRRP